MKHRDVLFSASILYLHAIPWLLVISICVQFILVGWLHFAWDFPSALAGQVVPSYLKLANISLGVAGAGACWIAVGFFGWTAVRSTLWIAAGLVLGIVLGIGIVAWAPFEPPLWIAISIAIAIAVGLADWIAFRLAAGAILCIAVGIALLDSSGIYNTDRSGRRNRYGAKYRF